MESWASLGNLRIAQLLEVCCWVTVVAGERSQRKAGLQWKSALVYHVKECNFGINLLCDRGMVVHDTSTYVLQYLGLSHDHVVVNGARIKHVQVHVCNTKEHNRINDNLQGGTAVPWAVTTTTTTTVRS